MDPMGDDLTKRVNLSGSRWADICDNSSDELDYEYDPTQAPLAALESSSTLNGPLSKKSRRKKGEPSQSIASQATVKKATAWRPAAKLGRGNDFTKPQCQFYIGIEADNALGYPIKRRLLGPGGAKMKSIFEQTGAKLRLRGRGSDFLEGKLRQEADEPLMLCLSGVWDWDSGKYDREGFELAASLAHDHLKEIHAEFAALLESRALPIPDFRVLVHDGRRKGAR
eukprot:gnl/TRDRNA2_/TRDRNA2_165378_c0_seq1.p1 gnl/TRDRNA2_/TRDRNA2_165378_c0~~gnl/TRDRNA2_/TRDRNA2_165378_c0_seq1.p1  ORF type:complete len:225 (+),score=48.87 gnl/TRDRNA2_/TRDRNA2_165378_c0_seq1:69-743(+)